jgi:hypothetical protein
MNALADVVNGQQNTIEILFENKTPDDIVLKTISGMFELLYSGNAAELLPYRIILERKDRSHYAQRKKHHVHYATFTDLAE